MSGCNVVINGVEFEPKKQMAENYVIVRTYSAGVFAGYLVRRDGQEVELKQARRIWKWSGAASLSQLAVTGPLDPDGCKFPVEVSSIILTQAIEILPVTEEARARIAAVAIWEVNK